MDVERSTEAAGSGDGKSAGRCAHDDLRLAVGSGLVLVVVLLAALFLSQPDSSDTAKPVYRLGTAQHAGEPESVAVPSDQRSRWLNVGSSVVVTNAGGTTGRSGLQATELDANDLGFILGVTAVALLAGFVICRSRYGQDRWGCQCGERPLVRAGIPNNPRRALTARSVVPPGCL